MNRRKKFESPFLNALENFRLIMKGTGLFDQVESELLFVFALLSLCVGVALSSEVSQVGVLSLALLARKIILLFGGLSLCLLIASVLVSWKKSKVYARPKNWLDA